jgi:transposase
MLSCSSRSPPSCSSTACPLHENLLARLRQRSKLFADETTVPVLDPGRGRTKTGQLWAYAADDRPWGGSDPPGVAYVYAPDRKADRPIAHLAGFKGILQVDGYAGYPKLAERGDVELAFCWAHMRRNFYDLAISGPAPIASEALKRIAEFYAIEKDINGRSAEERCLIRQQRSRPLADTFEQWLRSKLVLISQKSKLADAINYALTRWKGLTRFIDDGRIELDNNTVERSIRPIKMRESLCTPSSSVCKHWKRARVDNATRATFPGHRRFDRLRRQVVGTDLMRCAGNNLHSRKDTGFDKAPYGVVCDA